MRYGVVTVHILKLTDDMPTIRLFKVNVIIINFPLGPFSILAYFPSKFCVNGNQCIITNVFQNCL